MINWPHPELPGLLSKLDKIQRLEDLDIPKFQDHSLYRHLLCFKETLLWWYHTTPNATGTPLGIFLESCRRGPEFADELDDAIKYSLRESSNCTLLYGGAEWPDTIKKIKSIDEFYSPYHLPPFSRPESGDINLLFEDCPKIEEALLTRFKNKVQEFIQDPISDKRVLDDVDRLKFLTTSTTYDVGRNCRVAKSLKRAVNATLETTKTFIFDYVEVFKAPHESRACLVPSPETLNSLVLLEAQMAQVYSSPSDVFQETEFSWLPKWLSFYSKKLYIMSDQRKSGLTFPLVLVKAFYETLATRFPEWDFDLIQGYFPGFVKVQGKMRPITNGVGLGMLNATVSAITSTLFEIWKEDQNPDLHLDAMFYNDDQVIRATYLDARRNPLHHEFTEMAHSWDEHLETYGLQVHKKKPFVAASGIFLEVYGEGFPVTTTKRCQKLGNLFKPLVCGSIAQAKERFSSSVASLENYFLDEVSDILSRIISYWGYEFHPEEASLPVQLGGWVGTKSEEGLDELFVTCSNLPDRFARHVNLIQVKRSSSTRIPDKWKGMSSRLSFVREHLKGQVLPVKGLWADYSTMALSAIGQTRLSSGAWVRREKTFLTARLKALKVKPLRHHQLTELFWEKVLEEGKAYAPPPSIASTTDQYSCWGTSLEIGNKRNRESNLLRDYFNLWKKLGYLEEFSFWEPKPSKDVNELLYRICTDVCDTNIRASPVNVLFTLILGWHEWYNMYTYMQRVYGRYHFRVPETVKSVASLFFGADRLNNSILIDHDLQMIFMIPVEDVEGFELFRIQQVVLDDLRQTIENMPESVLPDKPIFRTWDELREILQPAPQPAPNETFDPGGDLPISPEEQEDERLLMLALISQVRSVIDTSLVDEVAIRSGTIAQITGQGYDADEFWDAEDSFGIDFGE